MMAQITHYTLTSHLMTVILAEFTMNIGLSEQLESTVSKFDTYE